MTYRLRLDGTIECDTADEVLAYRAVQHGRAVSHVIETPAGKLCRACNSILHGSEGVPADLALQRRWARALGVGNGENLLPSIRRLEVLTEELRRRAPEPLDQRLLEPEEIEVIAGEALEMLQKDRPAPEHGEPPEGEGTCG